MRNSQARIPLKNVHKKSPNFTCYELLWLSRGNGKGKISLLTRTDLYLYKTVNCNITGHKRSPLFSTFSFNNGNFLFSMYSAIFIYVQTFMVLIFHLYLLEKKKALV